VPNEAGLEALGRQIDKRRATTAKHPNRRRRVKWTLGIIGVVIVVLIGTVAGYGWYLNHEIHRIAVGGLTSSPAQGVDQGTENILLVGSTNRCALKIQNPAYGLCSQGVNGINSDVVMILHLNAAKRTVTILSIPRDLFVPNAREDGANKIDAALYEGPTQLVRAIRQDFGIPIQHYVELNFDTFANVVDALGGISMYFPEPVYDAYSGLNIQTTGCIHLSGIQALQVVRARHLQYKPPSVTTDDVADWPYDPQSDLARIRRDHEFLRVLATAVARRGLGNPITDRQLVSSVVTQLVVDSGFSASHMVGLVLTFHAVNANTAPQLTVPVLVDQFGDYIYQGGDYGDVEFPIQPADQQTVERFLGISSNTDSMTGDALAKPSSVTVSVLNGTGVLNQATDTATALRALGFAVPSVGDTPAVATESETVVWYGSTAPATVAAAQAVLHALSGWVIMGYNPEMVSPHAEVTVVTGSNFSVNPPPPTTAPSTTTTTTTVNTGAFSAATLAQEPLSPWDPRSCTASGGEGT